MDIFSVLTMIGGLSLFLYGMHVMGQSLGKLAGGKLESLLEKLTDNPVKAVLLGSGVTAVIQSSSATTVMVVGFVNSGLMSLKQSVGIIMGANIGTTITSWILSLAGIEGNSVWVRLLKPSSFSPILALIGAVFLLFCKSTRKKDLGNIFLGFAVLMFGMETMSGAVKPLAKIPAFTNLFTMFENPFLGMCVGAILTAIIQSSSASVGILQALCLTGSVSLGSAIPIIMGQNIGTCVTALISAIGAQKNAKRSALVHLYFNLIGTILFMTVFYTLNAFLDFQFLKNSASATSIAIIHSGFNISATLLLLPFRNLIEKLTLLTIPVSKDEEKRNSNELFDMRLLETPGIAVALVRNAVCDMAQSIQKSFQLCTLCLTEYDEKKIKTVMEIEDDLDNVQVSLTSAIEKLASKELDEKDSHRIFVYEKAVTDFERISDYEKSIVHAFEKMNRKKEKFTKEGFSEAKKIFSATNDMLEETVNAFIHEDEKDEELLNDLFTRRKIIKSMKKEIQKNHKARLENGECSVDVGIVLIEMTSSLNRIAGHLKSVAEVI
ncbi:MAG: Na/Pi cotransporter family protein [Treponema sp.]|nr:Na/Pi cotransporter family protein [Treponema sp.]